MATAGMPLGRRYHALMVFDSPFFPKEPQTTLSQDVYIEYREIVFQLKVLLEDSKDDKRNQPLSYNQPLLIEVQAFSFLGS